MLTAAEIRKRLDYGLTPASILYHVGALCAQPGQTPEGVAAALGEKTHWVTTKLAEVEKLGGPAKVRTLISSEWDSRGELKALQKLRQMFPKAEFLSIDWWREIDDLTPSFSVRSARTTLRAAESAVLRDARVKERSTPQARMKELRLDGKRLTKGLTQLQLKAQKLLDGHLRDKCVKDIEKALSLADAIVARLAQAAELRLPRDRGHRDREALASAEI